MYTQDKYATYRHICYYLKLQKLIEGPRMCLQKMKVYLVIYS